MERRSFCLTHEDAWQLENVKQFQDLANVSEAMRFCVQFTYSHLCLGNTPQPTDELHALVKKNNIVLRQVLIEVVRTHEGKAKPLTTEGRRYLQNLREQMQNKFGENKR